MDILKKVDVNEDVLVVAMVRVAVLLVAKECLRVEEVKVFVSGMSHGKRRQEGFFTRRIRCVRLKREEATDLHKRKSGKITSCDSVSSDGAVRCEDEVGEREKERRKKKKREREKSKNAPFFPTGSCLKHLI